MVPIFNQHRKWLARHRHCSLQSRCCYINVLTQYLGCKPPPGLFVKSAPPLEYPSSSKSLSIAGNFANRRQGLLSISCDRNFRCCKQSSITALQRLARQNEAALAGAQISEIETADIRRECAGK